MPAEKPTTKSSENRRSNKPIMEKRRRARINSCLNDLKALILEALKKDPARHSKLEKADILEMTVKHLQNLQRQQMALSTAADPNVANKFRAGFNECANEVTRFLTRADALDQSVQQRLMGHLANCLNGIGGATSAPTQQATASSYQLVGGNGETTGNLLSATTVPSNRGVPTSPVLTNPLNIHVPSSLSGGNTSTVPISASSSSLNGPIVDDIKMADPSGGVLTQTRVVKGLQFVPTRLPNGDIALLLPANYSIPLNGAHQQQQLPATPGGVTSMLSPLSVNTRVASNKTRKSVISPLPLTPVDSASTEHVRERSTSILTTTTSSNVLSPLTVNTSTPPCRVTSSSLTTPSSLTPPSSCFSPPMSNSNYVHGPWVTSVAPLRELATNGASPSHHNHYQQDGLSRGRSANPVAAADIPRYYHYNVAEVAVKGHSQLAICKEMKNGPWRPW